MYHIVALIKRLNQKEERIDREIEVLAPIRQNLKVLYMTLGLNSFNAVFKPKIPVNSSVEKKK